MSAITVALIQPAAPADGPFERLGRSDLPPLGLLYLAAALQRAGHRVEVIDLNLPARPGALMRRLSRLKPHVIGLGTMAPCYGAVIALARELQAAMPSRGLLIAGGADATTRTELYSGIGLFDAVLVGEAERSLVTLCDAWPEVPRAPGILRPGELDCEPAAPIEPDEAPLPARELLPLRRYRGGPAYKRGRHTVSVFTHRGCPYRCTFCEQGVHAGRTRFRSAESIFDEVTRVRREYGIHDVRFVDDVLVSNRPVLERLLELIERSGDPFDWMCTGRVDLADEETLRRMRRAGCYRIEYGVESGSERVLRMVDKGFALDRTRAAVEVTRRAGVETIANFILGFPTETEDELLATVDFALELDPEYAIFFPFCPYQGAPMTRQYQLEWGPEYPAFRAPNPAYVVSTPRLMELVDEAYGRFYFRPGYVARRAASIRSPWIVGDLALMAAAHAGRRASARLRPG